MILIFLRCFSEAAGRFEEERSCPQRLGSKGDCSGDL